MDRFDDQTQHRGHAVAAQGFLRSVIKPHMVNNW